MANSQEKDGVLIIYTGGTIGSILENPNDPLSPLVPGKMNEILDRLPNYNERDRKILLKGGMVRLEAVSIEKPIDSSNVCAKDWIEMATLIKQNYNDYEGFVLLHGTDTMAYTSSCLAFMLDNLAKPVIITGSQLPIGLTRSDAVQNIVSAVEIAAARSLGHTVTPEVTVLFHDKLYRGSRLRKISASGYAGFDTPNMLPLGEIGEHIFIRRELLRKASDKHTLAITENLNDNVISLDIFPGIKAETLKAMFNTENLKGVVIKTFGTGNAPTTPEFLEVIEWGVREKGLLIVNVTQCLEGEVEQGLYDVSAGLLSAGVISGLDMTPEAALTKMFVILGKGLDTRHAADMMQLNLKGEQRASIYTAHFLKAGCEEKEKSLKDTDKSKILEQDGEMSQGYLKGAAPYNAEKLTQAFLRILGLQIPGKVRGRIEFKVYLDDPSANESSLEEGINYIGMVSRRYTGGTLNVILDVTKQAEQIIDSLHSLSLTLVPMGGDDIEFKDIHIALMTAN